MPSLNPISGNVAIVTGSSRGIGLAIAKSFLSAGASVVISGIDEDETESAGQALSREYGQDRVRAIAGDVSAAEYANELVETATFAFSRLDSIVCNAGIDIIKPAVDYTFRRMGSRCDNQSSRCVPACSGRGARLDCQRLSGVHYHDLKHRFSVWCSGPDSIRCQQRRYRPDGANTGG